MTERQFMSVKKKNILLNLKSALRNPKSALQNPKSAAFRNKNEAEKSLHSEARRLGAPKTVKSQTKRNKKKIVNPRGSWSNDFCIPLSA